MSIEDARKFIADLNNDDQLRLSVHLDRDHILSVASAKGYTVTPAEIKTALTEHWATYPGEDLFSKVLSESPGF